jgi:serine phosphatase RsbU (regulator of sigma subunit)
MSWARGRTGTGLAVSELFFPGGTDAAGMPAALHDPKRLAAVAATGLLDTGPEPVFEDLADLAATLTGCSRAFITLVDEHRSFWKSCIGVDAPQLADRQNRVEDSFCYFLIGLADRFAVEDAATDPRTRDHPSVKPMKIGAWAGYPILSTGGDVLGSMCVIDENPHPWQPAELSALATMARAASNEMNLRQTLEVAQASLQLSQDLARSLQDSLLPPVLEPVPGLEASASYVPAAGGTDVVGDFYDLFHIRGPWWCAAMGDVCGKGTEAAKLTALARYTLRAAASHHLSPAAILRELNTALIDQHHAEKLVTAMVTTFQISPGGMSGLICAAGHPPALILQADGLVRELGQPGMMLGIFSDITLTETRFQLKPGDTLLLYTDGVTEARHPRQDETAERPLFGEQALAQALADCSGQSAQAVIRHLGQILDDYTAHWASDDTALLALRVLTAPPADLPRPRPSHGHHWKRSPAGASDHTTKDRG